LGDEGASSATGEQSNHRVIQKGIESSRSDPM
jgi:hypothetical protein